MSTIKKVIPQKKKKEDNNTENQELGSWEKQLLQASNTVHGASTWEIQLLQKTYWREINQDSIA